MNSIKKREREREREVNKIKKFKFTNYEQFFSKSNNLL